MTGYAWSSTIYIRLPDLIIFFCMVFLWSASEVSTRDGVVRATRKKSRLSRPVFLR